jgi:hypothetical protein
MDEGVFIIVVLSILSATLICCLPIVLVFWAVTRKRRQKQDRGDEELRLRRIWDGLQRMEERLDNIETIISPARRERTRAASSGGSRHQDEY